ncbi:lon protease homolog 2, peroxisomal [Bombina bombina]|uniref:lon protease homolog 2, peroxisomal n=1 Tax=Bombina bombina TaxID=8345 RepID=UPI00235AA32D|nr:lon protease homolog 2, peroxisomal [Bombina bombina]
MGAKFAPSYANIFMGWLEINFVYADRNPFIHHIRLYKRLIDDLIIIWSSDGKSAEEFTEFLNISDNGVKFTHEWQKSEIHFLDVNLRGDTDTGTIISNLYRKPIAGNTLLHHKSAHPKHVFKGITKGQLLRAKRICNRESDYKKESQEIKNRLLERGYNQSLVDNALDEVTKIKRGDVLQKSTLTKSDHKTKNCTLFITKYSTEFYEICRILKKYFPMLYGDKQLKTVVERGFKCVYSRNVTLGNILSPSQITQNTRPTTWLSVNGTYKCGVSRCKACDFITEGKALVKADDILEAFTKYYSELYSAKTEDKGQSERFWSQIICPTITTEINSVLNSPISNEEISKTISELSMNKVAGPDGIPNEVYKILTQEITPHLCNTYNDFFITGKPIPADFSASFTTLLLKGGKDPNHKDSYRPIALLNSDYKILASILARRLQGGLPYIIHNDQAGFIHRRNSASKIREVLLVSEFFQTREEGTGDNKDLAIVAIDAAKAFDSVYFSHLFTSLNKFGFRDNFPNFIKNLYTCPHTRLIVNNSLSSNIIIERGTRQGCPLSPLLFNIAIESLAIRIRQNIEGVRIGEHEMKAALYADDILLYISNTKVNIPQLFSIIDQFGSFSGIGTAALAVQVVGSNWPKPHYTLLVTGLCRFQIMQILKERPYPVAEVEQLDRLEELSSKSELKEALGDLSEQFYKYAVQLLDMLDSSVPAVIKLKRLLNNLPKDLLPDVLSSIIRTTNEEKLQILEAVELEERFKVTIPLLLRQIEGLKLLQKTQNSKLDQDNKRVLTIRPMRKLGAISGKPFSLENTEDDDEDSDDILMIERKIKSANMPETALKVCIKELKRLKKMPHSSMPEYALTRNYLELMSELPWSKSTKDCLDIRSARILLDNDHYAMEKLKRRVLEYLAVRQLKNNLKGPILCFVGPPGVGKTSVGRSIAKTLGREFHRIALGGVCDQSDIRGHRRTYVGSMPGRIINGLKTVGVNNPVFLLDEVDKLGKSLQGDPAAALLEVLDPEQNHNFTDHYLNVPFDLSQVLFIATANTTASIPPPLLDRMEVIQVPGYSQEEKVEIAHRHLISKQLAQHGLTPQQIQIPQETTLEIITRYTREAGVRSLDRKFGAICRAVAVKVAEGQHRESKSEPGEGVDREEHKMTPEDSKSGIVSETADLALPPEMPILIDRHALRDILGAPMYEIEVFERLNQPGVAIGLAWTPLGGEIMFVEASRMDGEGQLTLTGQLGDVMKESAHLAISWLRSNAKKYHLTNAAGSFDLLDNTDIHLHFPAGAVTKDGPSAGVAIVTCLASLFSGQLVSSDIAMTGEITLRGLVLPVGGIKDKVLAAHRAGLKRVMIPKRNEKDLEEIPLNVRRDLHFVMASSLDEVLNAAFDGGFSHKITTDILNSKL